MELGIFLSLVDGRGGIQKFQIYPWVKNLGGGLSKDMKHANMKKMLLYIGMYRGTLKNSGPSRFPLAIIVLCRGEGT